MPTDEIPIGLKKNANWRRLWAGQAVSLVGDFVFNTTVVLWVATVIAGDRPWSAAAVAGVLIAAGVPVLLIAPFAGVYVDRWDRRRTMMIADVVRAGLIATLLVVPVFGGDWAPGLQLTYLYTVVFLTSATSQFFNPARFAVISSTVATEDRPKAFGLLTASSSTAAVIGPPLAAPLLFVTGVQWSLLVNVFSFLLSFLLVRAIRIPGGGPKLASANKGDFWPQFKEGLGFFFGNRTLVLVVGGVCVYMFGVGAINVLDVFFVTENLKVDAGWLGTLSAAFGLGSVAGALLAGKVIGKVGEVRSFTLGMVLTGVLLLIYSRTTSLPLAIGFLALCGLPVSAINVVVGPLVLRTTPNHLVGRISTVMNPLVYLSSLLSMAVTGFVASTVLHGVRLDVGGVVFGRVDLIFTFSAIMMITAGLLAYRPLSRQPSPAPAEAPLTTASVSAAQPESGPALETEPELAHAAPGPGTSQEPVKEKTAEAVS
jgi:MFS family permease